MAKKPSKSVSAAKAVTITIPKLAKGEKYRGIVLDANGKLSHHVVLLPGVLKGATHQAATDWAKKQGGELPDRADGALLYANNSDGAIEKVWHWLAPQFAGSSDYAWCQYFDNGDQGAWRKGYAGHAVAVRKVSIQ